MGSTGDEVGGRKGYSRNCRARNGTGVLDLKERREGEGLG